MKSLPFRLVKADGAGNIFVCVDARENSPFRSWEKGNLFPRAELAKKICSFAVASADGMIFFEEDPSSSSYRWDFYNSDGSSAEMCGNAARCVGAFAVEELSIPAPLSVRTRAGFVQAHRNEGADWTVEMPALQGDVRPVALEAGGRKHQTFFVNSGVPHLVLRVSSLDDADLSLCRSLRTHPDLGVEGANVTLLAGHRAKTYERGVEGFTAACGTGAVAAARVLHEEAPREWHEVQMPGGALKVSFQGKSPLLRGPAVLTARIEILQGSLG